MPVTPNARADTTAAGLGCNAHNRRILKASQSHYAKTDRLREIISLSSKVSGRQFRRPRSCRGKLPRRELVAERTARRALHDRLGAVEADFTIAGRDDVEIGRAYQQRAEFGLVQFAEEL